MSRKSKGRNHVALQGRKDGSVQKSGKDFVRVSGAVAPAKNTKGHGNHQSSPELQAARKDDVKVKVAAVVKAEREQFVKNAASGALKVITAPQADTLSAAELTVICKARGWAFSASGLKKADGSPQSGLTKSQLVEHVASGGTKYAPAPKGPTSVELRAECKVHRVAIVAKKGKGAEEYKGYSSQNKAGLTHMLDKNGAVPTLADGTYKVGTVLWMQRIAKEFQIDKTSGLKKDALMARIITSGKAKARDLVLKAITDGNIALTLPALRNIEKVAGIKF